MPEQTETEEGIVNFSAGSASYFKSGAKFAGVGCAADDPCLRLSAVVLALGVEEAGGVTSKAVSPWSSSFGIHVCRMHEAEEDGEKGGEKGGEKVVKI
jgi:hypothetical protein